jgi:uncharacterized protein YceH (UPF0502 family)
VSNAADMTALVTRGEMKEEFAQFEQRLEVRLAQMATKTDLEVWGGALEQRLDKRISEVEQRLEQRLGKRIDEAEQRLHADLAMLAKAHQESMATLISIIDEKYADLPRRVKRLEGAVFRAKRR